MIPIQWQNQGLRAPLINEGVLYYRTFGHLKVKEDKKTHTCKRLFEILKNRPITINYSTFVSSYTKSCKDHVSIFVATFRKVDTTPQELQLPRNIMSKERTTSAIC